jgi:hypothetical protein
LVSMLFHNLKYLLLAILLHASITSCNIPREVARLDYSVSGCFGGYTAQVLIYKKQGVLMARLEWDKKHIRTEKISTQQLAYFNQFVAELQHYKNNNHCYSTSYEVYRVVQKGLLFTQKPCGLRNFVEFTNKLFTAQSPHRV